MGNEAAYAGLGVVAFIIAILVMTLGFDYVPAGYAGVTDRFGEVGVAPWGPAVGNSGIKWTGIFTSTVDFDCRIQRVDYDASAASQDMQTVSTRVAVNFKLNPITIPEVYKTIGVEYQDIIIFPIVQESVKSATANYKAENLIKERSLVKKDITDHITMKLEEKGIFVTEVSITDFDFSEEFNRAIESKQVAEQSALEAKNKLDEMRYTSEAMQLQKEVIEIKKLDIQMEWIAKWNGMLPNTLITSGDTVDMLLNLPTVAEEVSE